MQKRKPADRVYLIRNINEGVVEYKIGITGRSAEARIQDMSTSNAGSMDVVAEFKTAYATTLEGVLHAHYNAHHKKGEWFSSGAPLTADQFVSVCEKLEHNLRITWGWGRTRVTMNRPYTEERVEANKLRGLLHDLRDDLAVDELWDDILA
jgi:hypothetical protein